MSNKSLDNLNTQFIDVLKSLNIEDNKHQKLSINLDLKKKIKTIISIQSLEERKSHIPKYLNNSNSYISLLSLSISLTTKTLYTIFCNHNGREILKNVIQNSDKEKTCLAIDLVYRLIKTYDLEFDIKLLIEKACEYEKWEVLDLVKTFDFFFDGDCLCQMLIYKFLHKLPDEFVSKIQQSKFNRIFEYIKNNRIYASNISLEKENLNNLEKILLDTLFIRTEKGLEVSVIRKSTTPEPVKITELNICQNSSIETKKSDTEEQLLVNESKPTVPVLTKPDTSLDEKKTLKKKFIFKKKESSVAYLNIKWTKMHKVNTVFENINVDSFKSKFSKEDLDYFIVKKEIKKTTVVEKGSIKEVIMDPKKSYALNIALSRVKEDYKDVLQKIYNNDTTYINENLVNQLLLYFPTCQEMDNIMISNSTDKYVLFFKECGDRFLDVKENLLKIKLDILIRNFNFNYLLAFIGFFRDIKTSMFLNELLGIILYIGNIVNKGSTYANAEGFSILDIHNILNMRMQNNLSSTNVNCNNKISDFSSTKKDNIFTFKDLIRNKIRDCDVNLSIKNISYDNLLTDIQEINNVKKDLNFTHVKYDELINCYRELMSLANDIKKAYNLEKINDEIICIFITICEIFEKHN